MRHIFRATALSAVTVITGLLGLQTVPADAVPSVPNNRGGGVAATAAGQSSRPHARGHVAPISSPGQVPHRCSTYSFGDAADGSEPMAFRGGTLQGNAFVVVVGDSWGTWQPPEPGKHLLFAADGVERLTFTRPTRAILVKAEPNAFGISRVTLTVHDRHGDLLGSVTRGIEGFAGADYLGLVSHGAKIKRVTLASEEAAFGFAFSDLTRSGPQCP
jgi:hypothetical protein